MRRPPRAGGPRWRDWPWAAKIVLLLGTLSVVPLAAVTLFNGMTVRSELIAATREQNLQRARSTAETLDDHLESVLSDLLVVARHPQTVRLLSGSGEPGLQRDVTTSLLQVQRSKGLDALFLAGPDGAVALAVDRRLEGRNILARKYFLQAASGNASIHEPRYEPEDRRVYLHASAPVRLSGGPIVGVAVARLGLRDLDEILRGDLGFAGRGEYGVLWDAQGIRLSHPSKPSLRFKPFAALLADAVARMAAEGRFGPRTREILHTGAPLPAVVERSRWLLFDPGLDPHLRLETPGGPVYGALVPLRSQRWCYGIFSPESAILATVREHEQRAVLVAALAALLAVTAGWFAARWATRPLRLVGQTANAIAAGDMSRRVALRQRDEVGQVAAAFDAMADELAAKEAELRGHAGRLEQRVAEQTAELRELVDREHEARERAEEANRLKDEFLNTVSHELRTPLNAILGWTWLLLNGRLDEAGTRRAVETIDRNARTQGQIVDDLLDVSRIVTGKLKLHPSLVPLAPVVEAAVDSARPAAEARGIRIESRLQAGPELRADPTRLQQIAGNLLSNAVKFTPPGGRIEVSLDDVDGHARIRVADTGIGIPQDFLPFIFDRFRQADSSTTRAYGGLGLGLSITRHLVELHGGSVEAESPGEGLGAVFTVKLPLAQTGAEPAAEAAVEDRAGREYGRGERI